MAESWLSNVGIRVTNLEKSLEFYKRILDLIELKREQDEDSAYVLLKDRRSGQRIELNWYAESNPFYAPYVPGEGLDHLDVRVKDVPGFLEGLARVGIKPVTRTLWVNRAAVEKLRSEPRMAQVMGEDVWTTRTGHRVAHVLDPDGNLVALYDHPEEDWEGPIPDGY